MKRNQLGVALIFALAVALSSGFASGGGGQSEDLLFDGLAKQRGCRDGGTANKNRVNPSWVSVQPTDEAVVAEGIVRVSKVTYEDFPNCHESHDWNIFVKLDPEYEQRTASRDSGLNSDANRVLDATTRSLPADPKTGKVPPDRQGDRVIEIEWEKDQYPEEFRPIYGDRIWTIGRWVFDCGHPPYRSEIHPPKGIALTREEAHVFTGDAVPSNTNKVYVFFNGQGGYYYDHIGGRSYEIDVPMPPRPSETAEPRYEIIKVPYGNIRPQITLPGVTRPPTPPALRPPITAEERAKAKQEALESGEIPGKTRPNAADRLNLRREELLESRRRGNRSIPSHLQTARITYDLTNVNDSPKWDQYAVKWVNRNPQNGTPLWAPEPPRATNTPKFGAIIALGWKEPATTRTYRKLQVTFDSIKIINDHDSGPKQSGEWHLWLQANGNWFKVDGLGDVDDGDTVKIGKSIVLTVPEAQPGIEGGMVQVQATGWESDPIDDDFKITNPTVIPSSVVLGAEDLDNEWLGTVPIKGPGHANQPLGVINRRMKVGQLPATGRALFQEQSIGGDYRLDYRIDEIGRIPAGTSNTQIAPEQKFRTTVDFRSIRVVNIANNKGKRKCWFEFDINGKKLRYPEKGYHELGQGDRAFFSNLTSPTFTGGPKGITNVTVTGRYLEFVNVRSLGEITRKHDRSTAGLHESIRSVRKDGEFEVTYRVDTQPVP